MMMLGILLGVVPFVFAALRATTTGNDFRYFWLALASTLMAAFILAVPGRPMPAARRTVRALIAATVTTFVVGGRVGGANTVSVFIVALGFAICSTAGVALILRARAHETATSTPD